MKHNITVKLATAGQTTHTVLHLSRNALHVTILHGVWGHVWPCDFTNRSTKPRAASSTRREESLAQKDAEIGRLQKLAAELKAQHAGAPAAATAHAGRHATPVESGEDFLKPLANMSPVVPIAMQEQTQPLPSFQAPSQVLSAEEQEQLAHVEAKRFEWEQRCVAAEQRLQMLQQQLTESSKRYGSDISSLEVEIAKKDARIKELEFLMKQHE